MTELWLGALCLVFTGAITPGPNNFVVMAAGAQGGWRAALPSITGIVVGSIAVLELAAHGAQAAMRAVPGAVAVLTLGACTCLMWLGLAMIANTTAIGSRRHAADLRALPSGFVALVGFQFLNPKSWIMAIALTSTGLPMPHVLALFCVVSALCLGTWCALGQVMARHLSRPGFRCWLDRCAGVVLILSSGLLAQSIGGAL